MDEIFNRIKSIKIKRKTLVVSLILTELLGISVLVWFLRIPLTLKYLTIPPKVYSAERMVSDKRYVVKPGDIIVGENESKDNQYYSLLRQGTTNILNERISDDAGWSFIIPQDIKSGKYALYILKTDKEKKSISTKLIRLNIKIPWLTQFLSDSHTNNLLTITNMNPTRQHLDVNKKDVYYADLEYNFKDRYINVKDYGVIKSERVNYSLEQPKDTKNQFIIRIDTYDLDRQLLSSGWDSFSFNSTKDSVEFKVFADFAKGNTIKIFTEKLDLLWTGIIK